MSERRFHPRRSWHNTRLVLWAVPPVVLLLVLQFAISGKLWPAMAFGAVASLVLVLALYRDRGRYCRYELSSAGLVLGNAAGNRVVQAPDIIDASLIDRAAARAYIQGKAEEASPAERRAMVSRFVAYCSVDIGLTSYTFGLGRGLIDRLPAGRSDLVLMRTREGGDLLLSPHYPQDMVDAVNRWIMRTSDERAGARVN